MERAAKRQAAEEGFAAHEEATAAEEAAAAVAEKAAQEAEDRINDESARTLRDSPTLRRRYDELIRTQEKIDARLREGRPVPRVWIANTFHEHYYEFKGRLEEAE